MASQAEASDLPSDVLACMKLLMKMMPADSLDELADELMKMALECKQASAGRQAHEDGEQAGGQADDRSFHRPEAVKLNIELPENMRWRFEQLECKVQLLMKIGMMPADRLDALAHELVKMVRASAGGQADEDGQQAGGQAGDLSFHCPEAVQLNIDWPADTPAGLIELLSEIFNAFADGVNELMKLGLSGRLELDAVADKLVKMVLEKRASAGAPADEEASRQMCPEAANLIIEAMINNMPREVFRELHGF
jgi:hypothetical protein